MSAGAAPTGNLPNRLPHGAQLALAFLLGGITVIVAGRFLPVFDRPVPTRQLATGIDLNRADKAELMQLPHVSEKRADAILGERDRRGGFSRSGELRGVGGIGPAREAELIPHVRVAADEQWLKSDSEGAAAPRGKKEAPSGVVDVNRADVAKLQSLPGIGPVLAGRLLAERERGPFKSVDDLRRVSGIGPKTLEKIRPFVKVD